MALARCRHDWAQTSQVLCLIANVNRDPKKGRPFSPDDFNPYREPRPERPLRTVDAGVFADWLCGKTGGPPDEPIVVTPPLPCLPGDERPARVNGYNEPGGWSAI